MTTKTAVRFYFGDDPTFAGFADGTTWNGFDNVWVTADVHKQIVEHFTADYKKSGYEGDDLTEVMQSFDITPDADGLYSYANGFTTQIDDRDDDPIAVIDSVIGEWRESLNLDDSDFDDKDLQQERQRRYDRAIVALNDLRPLKDST